MKLTACNYFICEVVLKGVQADREMYDRVDGDERDHDGDNDHDDEVLCHFQPNTSTE